MNKKPIDPYILEILIIGMDGRVVSSTNEKIIGNNVSSHELFVNSIDHKFGETYVERAHNSPFLNENCIFISAPLTRKSDGKPIGIIISAYALESLNEIISNHQFQCPVRH